MLKALILKKNLAPSHRPLAVLAASSKSSFRQPLNFVPTWIWPDMISEKAIPLTLVARASLMRASMLLMAVSFGMDCFGGPRRSSLPRVSCQQIVPKRSSKNA